MARRTRDNLARLEEIVAGFPEGASAKEILDAYDEARPPQRTLQNWLAQLVKAGHVEKTGGSRSTRYRIAACAESAPSGAKQIVPLSDEGRTVLEYVRQPIAARKPVGYDRSFLERYRPNETYYLSAPQRAHLADVSHPAVGEAAAGTYAKQILNRLLIDLSWNSSRLEGNTYSLLDTRRLIDFGQEAEGHGKREAQMILNHKDAIEFLVASAEDIGFNRYTILNLHALLANNLLGDPAAVGRLRHIIVGIDGTTFHPLEVPAIIEECFDQLLATARAIDDPFEQAFFIMAQLPYLQPFDDVNKRVSRLSANIPLIKANLTPLAFSDVPGDLYARAMLGVYELNDVSLLRDVYLWAYERSAQRYAAVRQSLGEPDPIRLRYREELRQIIGEVVLGPFDRKAAGERIKIFARDRIGEQDRDEFSAIAETELLGLHEGNFARYNVRPSEFEAWRQIWNENMRN